MLQFLYEMEISLDQGCPMDTIIVHNNPLLENSYNSGVSDIISYQKCIDFLKTINGKNTKNGIIRIEERPNIGMSFGSFSYIFDKYKKDYDYWMFVEDDHILINNNVLSQGIKQLTSIEDIDRICGFVAIVGLTVKRKETGTFAYGGMGISGREILEQVCKTNNGILPFLDTFELQDDRRCHNRYGEKPFSQYIRDRLKYLLKNIGMKDVVMVWGGVPHWKESMRHTQNKRLLSIDKYQKYKTLYNF